jgi:hypothetical protein
MTLVEHAHDAACLLSLQDVAGQLGVTRAAANFMVRDGRLGAQRSGPRWYVCERDLAAFLNDYKPGPAAGRKLGPRGGEPELPTVVHALLQQWGEARVDELSEVLDRHPGNVRKYLAILRARGLAHKINSHTWVPTGHLVRSAT